MYWENKKNSNRQIMISRCSFPKGNHISLPWENFSLETCPIPIEEFKDYLDFPEEIISQGFERIKDYLSHQGAHKFICFTGVR